jgi:hypothetical protein
VRHFLYSKLPYITTSEAQKDKYIPITCVQNVLVQLHM